jgi:hypothetical protein
MLTLDHATSRLAAACDALDRWNTRTGNYAYILPIEVVYPTAVES